jgi:hypothetical protein
MNHSVTTTRLHGEVARGQDKTLPYLRDAGLFQVKRCLLVHALQAIYIVFYFYDIL